MGELSPRKLLHPEPGAQAHSSHQAEQAALLSVTGAPCSYLTLGTAPTAVPLKLPRPRLSPGLPAGVCPEPRGSQPKLTPPGKHKGGRCFAHVLTLTYLMSLKMSWCLKAFQYNGNCTIDNTRNKTS